MSIRVEGAVAVVLGYDDRRYPRLVIISAEDYTFQMQTARKARRTGTLTAEERQLAAAAAVPPEPEQKRYLTELEAAVENARQPTT